MKAVFLKHAPYVLLGFAIVAGASAGLQSVSTAPCPVRSDASDAAFPSPSPLLGMGKAAAIPAFARKFNMTCSTCHTAYPYLNAFGRSFKRAGYRVVDEDGLIDPDMQHRRTISKNLTLDEVFPIALGIEGAPLHATIVQDGDDEVMLTPFGELQLIGAGNLAWEGSYYAVITAEMEDDASAFLNAHGMVGWHPSAYFNLVGGHADPLHHDPYNSLSPHSIIAAHEHHSQAQVLQAYGYTGPLYYSLGMSGGGTGNLNQDLLGYARIAVEPVPEAAVGLFGFVGQRGAAAAMEFELTTPVVVAAPMALGDHHAAVDPALADLPSEDYLRVGADVNLDAGDVHVVGVGEFRRFDPSTGSMSEVSGFGEVFYTFTQDDRVIFMPLARVDVVRNLDNDAYQLSATADVSSYVTPNTRLGLEYTANVLKPDELPRQQSMTAFGKAYW